MSLSAHQLPREQASLQPTLDTVPFSGFRKVFAPVLRDRRVFLSACSVAQPRLARELFKKYEFAPYSVTGPCTDIGFADAAVTWAALYNLLFRANTKAIEGEHLRNLLSQVCRLNDLQFRHFGRIRDKPYYKEFDLPE